jgi:transposase InsO family protein
MRGGRRPEVHHSDQGVQYAATAYTEMLAVRGAAISTAEVGKPKDNRFAERLMRTIREGRSTCRSTETAPRRTVRWDGVWTTCTTGNGSLRHWVT